MELKNILVPIALFICITYAFKAVLDAVMRYRSLREPGTEDLLRVILQGEQNERRRASLRWGLVLVMLSVGLAVIDVLDWREMTPAVLAVLAGCTGAGHLVYYALSRQPR